MRFSRFAFFLALCLSRILCGQQSALNLSSPSPAPVTGVTASVVGNTGNATYYYFVIATYPIGSSAPSNAAFVGQAPAVLSASNSVLVTWQSVTGATGYTLLRVTTPNLPASCSACLLVNSMSGTSYNDIGTTPTSYTVSTAPAVSAQITLDNQSASAPFLNYTLRNPNPVAGVNKVPTLNGVVTAGNCLKAGTLPGQIIDAGGACGTTSGGITALTGDVTATGPGSTVATVKGINGVTLSGLASGLLFNTTGTGVPSIATSTNVISLFTGCSGTQYLGADGACHAAGSGSGTVTTVSFTGGLISVANPTSTPALTVAGTSGGVPYFNSATTWTSSAALTANALVKGGGAGVAPSSSSVTDNGTTVSTSEPMQAGGFNGNANTCSGQTYTAGGTIAAFNLVVLSSGTAMIAGTGGGGVYGVAQANATTGNPVFVCWTGYTNVIVDGTTTVGDILIPSTTAAGQAHDSGFTARSSVGLSVGVVGTITTASTGASSTSVVSAEGIARTGREVFPSNTSSNQGNGTKFQLSTGATTANDCVKFDANGNTVDAGAACGTGNGTVTSVATASPLTGGPITGSGTLSCPTCTTAASPLTSGGILVGGGGQAIGLATSSNILTGIGSANIINTYLANPSVTVNGQTCTLGGASCSAPGANSVQWTNYAVTIANGGSGAITMATPSTSFTAARTDAGQTFSGTQIFSGTIESASGSASTDSSTLGSEITSSGTCTTTGWTGTYPSYTHTTGNTSPITCTIPSVAAGQVYLSVIVSTGVSAGSASVTVGGAAPYSFSISVNLTASGDVVTTGTGGFVITPTSLFNGTLAISLKQYMPISQPTTQTYDSTGTPSVTSYYQQSASLHNVFIGGGGAFAYTGARNTSEGYQSMNFATNSVSTTAFGAQAGYNSADGSYNSLFGDGAGYSNVFGVNNAFFGYRAGYSHTNSNSVAIGYEAGYSGTPLTTGFADVYLGYEAHGSNGNSTNEMCLGANCVGNGTNTATIGNGTTAVYLTGATFIQAPAQSQAGSAGTLNCSEPIQGTYYKKVICYASGFTSAGGVTYTYPTAFTNTPVQLTTSSAPTVTLTISGSSVVVVGTLQTGFIILEGY